MTATRGKKNPSLLVQPNVELVAGNKYVATRPIAVGDLLVPAGVEVPATMLGPRPDAWVRARRLRLVRPDEQFTPFDEFRTMVEQAIDEAEQLLEQHRPPAEEDTTTEE